MSRNPLEARAYGTRCTRLACLPCMAQVAKPLLEPDGGFAIYLERVLMFKGITETGAEKFVVHIHVNLARKE